MKQRSALNSVKSLLAVGLSAALILSAPGPFAASVFANVVAGAAASGKGAAASSAAGAALTSIPKSALSSMGLTNNVSLNSGLTSAGLRGLSANPDLVPARTAQAAAVSAVVSLGIPAPAPDASNRSGAAPVLLRSMGTGAAAGLTLPKTQEQAGSKAAPSLTGMLKKIVRRYVPSRPKSEIAAQSRRLFDGSNVRRVQSAAPSALGIGPAL
ncbi:MAG: hypothetical protein V3S11_00290, partial [Elusimicrobiota bacterium]